MDIIKKITKRQKIYLYIVTIPTFIILLFPKFLDLNAIVGGIIINITIWSWFSIIVWNDAKEKHELRKENQELKDKLKERTK